MLSIKGSIYPLKVPDCAPYNLASDLSIKSTTFPLDLGLLINKNKRKNLKSYAKIVCSFSGPTEITLTIPPLTYCKSPIAFANPAGISLKE